MIYSLSDVNWQAVAAFIQVAVSALGFSLAFLGVLIALFGTHLLTRQREARARELRIQGNLAGLVAELKLAGRMAEGYLADNVLAPLYRIPLNAFERALPALMADRVLSVADIETLMDFYANAASINLGLAQSHQALLKTADDPRHSNPQFRTRAQDVLDLEAGRLKKKCEKGRPHAGSTPTLYDLAARVLAKHVTDPATKQALGL